MSASGLVPLCHFALLFECFKLILDEVTCLGLILAQWYQGLCLTVEAYFVLIVSFCLLNLLFTRRRLDGDREDYLSVWQRLLHHVSLLLS